LYSRNENLIKYLIDLGANVNKENCNGETLLFEACCDENEVIIKYLVEHRADVNKETNKGETPPLEVCRNGDEDNITNYIINHVIYNNRMLNILMDHAINVNKKKSFR